MSREAFEKRLKCLPDEDQQRIRRVANEFGIGFDDAAWIGLAVTEHGIIAVKNALAARQEAEQRIASH